MSGSTRSRLRELLACLGQGSFLRFFGASLFGLAIDIALASLLHYLFGVSLIASAAVSLLAAAVLMYIVHEFWTFRSAASALSLSRLAGTLASALIALLVRSGFLYTTTELVGLGERYATLQLVTATGVSFVLNFLLVRQIIGRRAGPNRRMTSIFRSVFPE
jgi:putative flippase GtrA